LAHVDFLRRVHQVEAKVEAEVVANGGVALNVRRSGDPRHRRQPEHLRAAPSL